VSGVSGQWIFVRGFGGVALKDKVNELQTSALSLGFRTDREMRERWLGLGI